MQYVIVVLLLTASALFAGLTLGLMGLTPTELKRKMSLGDEQAAKIYPIRSQGNLLLVSLLIGNVASNATLSIFLGSIAPGIIAGLVATGLITLFGEITPQAVFSHYSMELGTRFIWFVRIVMFVLYPIAAPLAWVLDKTLGEELPTVYSKKELVEILGENKESKNSDVQEDEERIAVGALTFGDKKIGEIMTPRSMIVAVEGSQTLDRKLLHTLTQSGYSRFPVYDGVLDKVTGMLYAYNILRSESIGKPISAIADTKVYFLNETAKLDQALVTFLKTKHHLFMVVNAFSEVTGVLGIEDVLEEILGAEIIDEFDIYDNVRGVAEERSKHRPAGHSA